MLVNVRPRRYSNCTVRITHSMPFDERRYALSPNPRDGVNLNLNAISKD